MAAELVSVKAAGTDSGDGTSFIFFASVLSADGTKLAFGSIASDLGPTDSNGVADVYFRDLSTGTTTLVSVNGTGTDSGNVNSFRPVLSADGTKVAFESNANDLGPTDSNGTTDVYLRDLTTGTTTLVSVNGAGTDSGNGFSSGAVISADGTRVAFRSLADDLGPTDTNGSPDIYLRDLVTGTTTLVSVNDTGTDSGNAGSNADPLINADGTKVAFESNASDLGPIDSNGFGDVYLRDLITGTTMLVSVNGAGTDSGEGRSRPPLERAIWISDDGTRVVFVSAAGDLGPTDTNALADVYVRDLITGTTTLASVNGAGTDAGNGFSTAPVISADGTKIFFRSAAGDLGPTDSNGLIDVYVRNLALGRTALVSANEFGTDGANGHSNDPVISAAGTKVAFASLASDLGPTDTGPYPDIYLRDLTTGETRLVSVNGFGTDGGNGYSIRPVLSAGGTTLAFESNASDLGPADGNGHTDVYVTPVAKPVGY